MRLVAPAALNLRLRKRAARRLAVARTPLGLRNTAAAEEAHEQGRRAHVSGACRAADVREVRRPWTDGSVPVIDGRTDTQAGLSVRPTEGRPHRFPSQPTERTQPPGQRTQPTERTQPSAHSRRATAAGTVLGMAEPKTWAERRLQGPTIHYQHQFKDQFPETRKKSMQLHAKRSYDFEYLKPGCNPVAFDFSKLDKRTQYGSPIHNVVDAVTSDPQQADMRMVLVDG